MPLQPFGRLKPNMHERRRRRHLLLLASVSVVAMTLALPAPAATFVYSDGDDGIADIALTGSNSFIAGSGATAQHTGVLSGTGSMSKDGAGKLYLNGDNTFSGGTVLNAGTLGIRHDNALGTGAVSGNGGALEFGVSLDIVLSNDFILNPGTATTISVLVDPSMAGSAMFSGAISGTGRLVKSGGGVLYLAGDNTFSGGFDLTDGIVTLQSDNAFGTGLVRALDHGGAISYFSGITIANDIDVLAQTIFYVEGGSATQAGKITATNTMAPLIKVGDGELILRGTNRVGLQGFNIERGQITAAVQNILDPTGLYSVGSTGTLKIAADQQIGHITGSGILDLASRTLTLAPGASSGSVFEGKLIGDDDAHLIKSGAGAVRLTGDGLDYFGRISLVDGWLTVDGNFAGIPIFASGGRLMGSGRLGDVAVGAATLVGRDGATMSIHNLSLSSGSIIEANLGTENLAPLFDVAGDIVLDGTLNVVNLGGFGAGVYRLFNYGGDLDDRGLDIGTVPNGYDSDNLTIQTAMAGQINLVADDPDYGPVLFWDGSDPANWNNGRVDGGSGQWRRGGSAFTDANGIANGPMNPHPGFVVFGGQAGTVSVNTGFGEIHPDGMQFAVDGYLVTGELISWDDGDRFVRVGDGTSVGAGYTAEITNVIDGGGRLVKTDLGTLVLSGDSVYRGGTEVRQGTLLVNGSILDVDVEADGRLGGSGTVNNANVRGTLAAGNSIGTLTIDGDLTMAAGSRLEVEVDALGNADRIDVTGVAYLEGGQVVTLASGGDYADQTRYTILTAEGGVDGEFAGVTSNLAFLDAALAYSAQEVELILSRNGVTYGNVGVTRNQIATGEAVESLAAGNGIYDRVLTLSADDARYAFDQLSGEVHASTKGVLVAESRELRDAMADRVSAAFDRLGLPDDQKSLGTSFWSTASGEHGSLKSDGNAAGLSYSAGNLFVGADAMFNKDWLLGFAVGYGQSPLNTGDRNSTSSSGNFHVGVYGGGEVDDFTFKFGAGYTHNDIRTTRNARFPGFDETLTAKYSGGTGQVFGEIGHKFHFDSGLIVEPYANLALANIYTGSYAEEGGTAALSSGGGNFGAAVVTVGVRGSQQFVIGDGRKATASGAIGWTHTAAGAPEAQQAFASGSPFTVAGAPIQGDSLFLRAGLGIELSANANFTLGYSGQFGSQGQSHGVNAGLSVKF